MAEGHQDIPLPDRLPPDVMTKRWFAKVYGFPDFVTAELDLDSIVWWPEIENAEAVAVERKQRQQSRVKGSRY